MSEKTTLDLPPWNGLTVSKIFRWYISRPEWELDVPGLRVLDSFNGRFSSGVNHRNYRLLKKSCHYDDDVEHELHKMAEKMAVRMKDHIFSGKDTLSVVAFLQVYMTAFNLCRTNEDAIQAIPDTPGRGTGEGVSNVVELRQILS